MTNYLETNYFVEEYGENDYPQILCNYIAEKYLKPHFKEIKGLEMLDLGSGKGNQLLAFDRLGLKVTGLDKRAECLDILESFTIKECDLENESLPFKNNSFDFIFSKSVIEHVENSDNFLSEIYRVLKKEGLLVLMTPDWDSQHSTFYDDYTHVKPWTRKGLQNALRMHEFLDVNCIYFKQLPILWRYPWLNIFSRFISLLPESYKWKNKEETLHRKWVRFSKEKMLLAHATKQKT